jgi:5-methylcytosine-specific restriction endonuclease McrA
MRSYSLTHLSDRDLLGRLAALVARDRVTTAELLAHISEVDARKLYLPAACPSMLVYCVRELHLSEDSALKRIHAARAAREFPEIFAALAEGRLHLSAVVQLAPHLTQENADGLFSAAAWKTKSEIQKLLAERFPRTELLPLVEAVPTTDSQLAPGRLETSAPKTVVEPSELAPGRLETPRAKVTPIAPQRFALHLSMGQSTHDKLRYAQELLSHQIPTGDIVDVIDRALDLLIAKAEKTKFAATDRPRRSQRRTTGKRHVPDHVRRAVWARDQGQCTFVSESGRRCPARRFLEFDHIDEVARGGQATVERMRLRCRAHNQYTAERTFGADFMENKREEARQAAEARSEAARAAEEERAEHADEQDVIPWIRALGVRAEEARRVAALCENDDAPLEERVRFALSRLHPKGRTVKYSETGACIARDHARPSSSGPLSPSLAGDGAGDSLSKRATSDSSSGVIGDGIDVRDPAVAAAARSFASAVSARARQVSSR